MTEFVEPLYLSDAIAIYINYINCYCSKKTIEYYVENLNRFKDYILNSDFLLPFDLDIYVEDISTDIIISYIKYLRSIKIKNVSVNTYVRAVRCFNNFLLKNGYVSVNWFVNVKKLRPDPSPVIPLTENEYNDIICYLGKRELSLRNICIFCLLCDCGLRLSEVIKLDIQDIRHSYIVIKDSKYNKSRFVPLPSFLYNNIISYTGCRSSGPVFVTKNHNRITKSSITKIFTNIKADLNLKNIHPHQLRHSFATSFVAGGGNLEILRILLGHSDLSITQHYIHVAQEVIITGINIHKIDNVFFRNYNN